MDRKEFLKLSSSSAMAAVALSPISKFIKGDPEPKLIYYSAEWEKPESDVRKNSRWTITLKFYKEVLQNYEKYKKKGKYRQLFVTISNIVHEKYGYEAVHARYLIAKPPKQVKKEEWVITAELVSKKIEKNGLAVDERLNVTLKDDIGRMAFNFAGKDCVLKYEIFNDCFLTSACTRAKGLPDDCDELRMLRSFRDDYMAQNTTGIELIREYEAVGPAVVHSIECQPNSIEIYESIYSALILPAIDLIREGKRETAMHFYKEYVLGLKQLLNVNITK